jgi:hypothetical protein
MGTFSTGGEEPTFTGGPSPAGLDLYAATDPRFTGTGRFPNTVLRALLYCHGLVIEDPLALAAEMYREVPPSDRAVARKAVESAVSSIVEIAPLLDAAVIQTFFT